MINTQPQIRTPFALPAEVEALLERAPDYQWFNNQEELLTAALGPDQQDTFDVKFDLPDGRSVTEATVMRVKNGLAANYLEPYMRRRDPNCMVISDDLPTDKVRYRDRFGEFDPLRKETMDGSRLNRWLCLNQEGLLGGGSLLIAHKIVDSLLSV